MLLNRLGEEKVAYTTRRQHGTKPPGMKCWASRPNGLLVLEFPDGEVIELATLFYAEGLEERPWPQRPADHHGGDGP